MFDEHVICILYWIKRKAINVDYLMTSIFECLHFIKYQSFLTTWSLLFKKIPNFVYPKMILHNPSLPNVHMYKDKWQTKFRYGRETFVNKKKSVCEDELLLSR